MQFGMAVAMIRLEISPNMPNLREKLAEESGYAMVMTALGFFMLLAFMGLAVDTGMMFQAKRKLQTAADAAATAAALDFMYNASTTKAITAGKSASASNGYTDGTAGVSVTISDPPTIGPNSGAAAAKGFFEAIVSQPVPTLFMATTGLKTMTIKARAVAGTPTISNICMWLMNPDSTGLKLQGSYDIEAPTCGMYINSTSSNGVSITGGGGTVNSLYIDAVGNAIPGHMTSPTPVTPNTVPRNTPWGNLNGPSDSGGGCTVDNTTTSITGTYSGPGAGSAICFTKAVTLSNAILGSTSSRSVYAFKNGVTVSGTTTVWGTLDIYGGTFNQGNAILNAYAPTSGTYDGIAIMQPTTNNQQLQVQFGSGGQTLDGYIYAPGAEVYLQDHGGGITATGIVADHLFNKSSVIRIPSYDLAHTATAPGRVVSMVE